MKREKGEKTDNSFRKSFFFFMSANIVLVIFVWFLVPETKKVSLEEIDVLFGGQNHIEKGGDLLNVEDPHHAHVELDMSGREKGAGITHVEQPAHEIIEN
jgi:hypothetical protein